MLRFATLIVLLTVAMGSCRSRVDYEGLSLKARSSEVDQRHVVFSYSLQGETVVQSICEGQEWVDSQKTCTQRQSKIENQKLRKLLLKEIKRGIKEARLKENHHQREFLALKKKLNTLRDDEKTKMSFHLYEWNFYKTRREMAKSELESYLDFKDALEQEVVFLWKVDQPEKFESIPLAARLRDIFAREKYSFRSRDHLEWRFVGNDVSFFGAQRACDRHLGGFRLPTAVEAESVVDSGLPQSSFQYVVKKHYPKYSALKSFWTSNLPVQNDLEQDLKGIRFMPKRAWAHNFDDSEFKGQLLLMNFRSTLFCVRKTL